MPELPEVEIVRQSLLKNIKGKKINKVLVRNRNLRFKLETSNIYRTLPRRRVLQGKYRN